MRLFYTGDFEKEKTLRVMKANYEFYNKIPTDLMLTNKKA